MKWVDFVYWQEYHEEGTVNQNAMTVLKEVSDKMLLEGIIRYDFQYFCGCEFSLFVNFSLYKIARNTKMCGMLLALLNLVISGEVPD